VLNIAEYPHRRYNCLTGQWVLVSPHRTLRPWQGKNESRNDQKSPAHEPDCYLCPGNIRANKMVNPLYTEVFVFENDFAALLQDTPLETHCEDLFRYESVRGTCRVICFSPRHDITLPRMSVAEIKRVVQVWCQQTEELGRQYRWVQIFENKGEIMGCSNSHPHGQVWAGDYIPNEINAESTQQFGYAQKHGSVLLVDYLIQEQQKKQRIIVENADWIALIPFWALWPYETLLLPKRPVLRLNELQNNEKENLAVILKILLTKYDNLFQVSFPYTMGWHGAPFTETDHSHWHLHAHFYPPLLRSATIKKFMVGYEMLSEPQRDLTVEQAAERLRNLSQMHYLSSWQDKS
jgi:UDPglucose--hexose-1-phosphate uridylyltransferase